MSDGDKSVIHDASDAGVAGEHPVVQLLPLLAAPSTQAEFNTLRLGLIPVACWRVDDIRFEFDSSFVLPGVASEIRILAKLFADHTSNTPSSGKQTPPLSIFGHADPVGNDDYNKFLSGRRAAAIYGMLTRRDDIWEDLFSNGQRFTTPVQGDKWGSKALQAMSQVTGLPDSTPRKQLFLAYMDALCAVPTPDGKTTQFKLDAGRDFLGHDLDAQGKGDYQGCGEFNPMLIFSQSDEARFANSQDKSERNVANAPNRRVMALLFRPGSRVLPAKWPCPRAKEGTSGCRKRFFSDGEKRRSTHLPDEPRKFSDTHDTFACRFYQRISSNSPCEAILRFFRIRLFDRFAEPVAGAPFVAVIEGKQRPLDNADPDGQIVVRDVKVPNTCRVFWSRPDKFKAPVNGIDPKPEDFEFSLEVFVDVDSNGTANATQATPNEGAQNGGATKEQQAEQRLNNLGFFMGDTLQEKIMLFQRELALDETGLLDDISDDLTKRHRNLDPPSRYNLPAEPVPPAPPGPQPPIPTPDGPADLDFS